MFKSINPLYINMDNLKDEFLDSIDEKYGKILIEIAKNAIKSKFSIKIDKIDIPEKFKKKCGAFVTINENNSLRGCIGFPYPVMELYKAVENSAIEAAFNDPRFMPLKINEIDKIEIEITILGEMKKLDYRNIDEITIGKHGLYIKNGIYSGILLPQVATEYNFTKKEFLEETCLKAGLNKDCYKNSELYVFEGKIIK